MTSKAIPDWFSFLSPWDRRSGHRQGSSEWWLPCGHLFMRLPIWLPTAVGEARGSSTSAALRAFVSNLVDTNAAASGPWRLELRLTPGALTVHGMQLTLASLCLSPWIAASTTLGDAIASGHAVKNCEHFSRTLALEASWGSWSFHRLQVLVVSVSCTFSRKASFDKSLFDRRSVWNQSSSSP